MHGEPKATKDERDQQDREDEEHCTLLIRVGESPSGRLGGGGHRQVSALWFLGCEPWRKIAPLPAGRES